MPDQINNTMTFANRLATQQLWSLASELHALREHPPLTARGDGFYEGNILSFVKGLRISAQIVYFLRDCLSEGDLDVSWGHILNSQGQSCSPECDVIIHKGHLRKWNGSGGSNPIMEFKFVRAEKVKAVISCKSVVTTVDEDYPLKLVPFGVDKVFLFGECCSQSNYSGLKTKALAAGYSGFWCSYLTDSSQDEPIKDDSMYQDFWDTMISTVL